MFVFYCLFTSLSSATPTPLVRRRVQFLIPRLSLVCTILVPLTSLDGLQLSLLSSRSDVFANETCENCVPLGMEDLTERDVENAAEM